MNTDMKNMKEEKQFVPVWEFAPGVIPADQVKTVSAAVYGITADDIAEMLRDIVPFEEQNVVRKYVLRYLDVFFGANARGGDRFSNGLAAGYNVWIDAEAADFDKVCAALKTCTGYSQKILSAVYEKLKAVFE